MYLEYSEYTGALDETAFYHYEPEAELVLDWYTFNRLQTEDPIPNRVKQCMSKVIDLLALRDSLLAQAGMVIESGGQQASGNPAIKSQSNDGVSISYDTVNVADVYSKLANTTEKGSEFDRIVHLYLNGIKDSNGRNLLYRGLYPGE